LTRTKYGKLYIRWHNINRLAYDDAAYLSLLNNFKSLGYIEDYDNCYLQYRIDRRSDPWYGLHPLEEAIRKRLDVFLEYLYGYGKRPLFPVGWSLITIIIFAFYWRWAGLVKREWPPSRRSQGANLWLDLWLGAFSFSGTVFLSGTKLFIDPPDLPLLQGRSQSMIRKMFLIERMLGALFSILFFLAIGGTIIR
jgi:hypothetical protein